MDTASSDDEGTAGNAGTKGVAVGEGFLAVGGEDSRIIDGGAKIRGLGCVVWGDRYSRGRREPVV